MGPWAGISASMLSAPLTCNRPKLVGDKHHTGFTSDDPVLVWCDVLVTRHQYPQTSVEYITWVKS